MRRPDPDADLYEGLCTFADVKTMLEKVATSDALRALNDAVEARFMRDEQQLIMSDAEWEAYTVLLARRADQVE